MFSVFFKIPFVEYKYRKIFRKIQKIKTLMQCIYVVRNTEFSYVMALICRVWDIKERSKLMYRNVFRSVFYCYTTLKTNPSDFILLLAMIILYKTQVVCICSMLNLQMTCK